MQLKKKPIGTSLAAATCGLLGALPSAPVAAQEATDWDIDSSLLFYGEDNDRVKDVSLDISIRRALDEDRSFNLNLTVDSLTGATPNGAVPTNAPQTFTGASGGDSYTVQPGEVPLDPTFLDTRIAGSASWQQSLGEASRWSVGFSASDEYDYLHLGANARFEHDFNLKNTTAFVGVAYGQDEINPVGGAPIGLTPMVATQGDGGGDDEGEGDDDGYRDGGTSQTKDVTDVLVGVTQILSRRSLIELSYSYGLSDGYLTDPYKLLSVVDPVTGIPVAGPDGAPFLYLYEKRPDTRAKQSVFAEWRHAFDRDSMAVSLRYMTDDWGVTSETLEARYRWNIGENSWIEPHLRYYTQSAADFYRTVLFNGDPLPDFASADYRLADLDAYTIGAKYGHRTDRGEWSVRLEYYRQDGTPSPGAAVGELANHELILPMSAVIAQFGYRFKF
jgi:Protein of unknown function (DUF3570)